MTVIVWPAATTVHYPVTRRRQKHVPRDHCSTRAQHVTTPVHANATSSIAVRGPP